MSTVTEVNARLPALTRAASAPGSTRSAAGWSRAASSSGMRDEYSLRGVTSNPAIFEQAILGSTDYDEELRELARARGSTRWRSTSASPSPTSRTPPTCCARCTTEHGRDGFVSLRGHAASCAHDTERTLAQARDYWARLDRPNAMIKIPGTAEGVPAIEQAIYEGINVNVTLLFGVEHTRRSPRPTSAASSAATAEGLPLDVDSVASFFVSRVDTEVDKRARGARPHRPRGHGGARQRARRLRAASSRSSSASASRRCAPPAPPCSGRCGPRPAPRTRAYSETKYVDELVGAATPSTRCRCKTLLAVAERGEIEPGSAAQRPERRAGRAGRRRDRHGRRGDRRCCEAGIEAFVTAMDKLLAGIETAPPGGPHRPPADDRAAVTARAELSEAIAARVATAVARTSRGACGPRTSRCGAAPAIAEIGDRLGWLTISDAMLERADELVEFARGVVADGFTDAVLLGMGGSSLGAGGDLADVRRARGGAATCTCSTRPTRRRSSPSSEQIDLEHTLFIVSTKSGGTLETLSLLRVLLLAGRADGSQFVAITDPGSACSSSPRDARLPRRLRERPRTSAGATRRCRCSGSCRRR